MKKNNKDCPVMISEDTKKRLSNFKKHYEDLILKNKSEETRRFISWDNTINYLLDTVKKKQGD